MSNTGNSIATACYAWEAHYVEPKAVSYMSKDDCLDMVQTVALRENLPIPKINFMSAANIPCYANISDWSINIAIWGRTPVTILHELAHLMTADLLTRGEDPHGPTFIAKCIDYYHYFLKIPVEDMREGARKFGLKIGVVQSADRHRPKTNQFDEIEF